MKHDNKARPPAPTDDNSVFDLRLQSRFVTKGNWTVEAISDNVEKLSDLTDATCFGEKQPALGLYSEEELSRIQKNFPYKR